MYNDSPRPPAIDGCAFAQTTLIQCPLIAPASDPGMSGTECLNLNITVPEAVVQTDKKVPVMVFIHGGGFIMGANYWPQNDPGRLVSLVAEIGMEVVIVGIKYVSFLVW
jgi:carboxylesterase type B